MESHKSSNNHDVPPELQEEWRASTRQFYSQNGFSKESDTEVINALKLASGIQLTPLQITAFLKGASLAEIVSGIANSATQSVGFRSKKEEQVIIQDGVNAASCFLKAICIIVSIFLLLYCIHLFFFSDTAEFMDALKP